MNKKKLRTASWLMALSILLLVLFQAYWLGKSWDDTYRRLRREVGVILRETVVRQQMAHFMDGKGNLRLDMKDSTITAFATRLPLLDTGNHSRNPVKVAASVNLLTVDDSGRKGKAKFMSLDTERPPEDDDDDRSQIVVEFPMPKGAVHLDSIKQNFSKALQEANIPLEFTIKTTAIDTSKRNGRRSDIRLRGGPGGQNFFARTQWENIQATSSNTFFFLLQKMQWPLIFAVAMMAVIIAALVFLWRNLRLQHQLADQKNDLIANITHELKTPIATVSVAIEALKSFNAIHDVERTKEYLEISGNELQRLNMLVDKVLKLSMFDQNKITLQQETVDMKKLVEEVLESMRLQLDKQNASVNFVYTGDNFETQGDRMHLLSVVYNLLDNAIKYSPKSPVIGISLSKIDGLVELKISDNGIGIPSEHLSKIFEKFYRVPHGDTHNIKGYGLGLSYVAEVVKRHGGKITVESVEGKGSEFKMTL